jgi:hypothetical protein
MNEVPSFQKEYISYRELPDIYVHARSCMIYIFVSRIQS